MSASGATAKVILDSWNGHTRLTTMEVTFWRPMLPEFNTHRAFSRNSASSRAIPLAKQIQRIRDNPAGPVFWGKNQPGMSAHQEVNFGKMEGYNYTVKEQWNAAMRDALHHAEILGEYNLHKQVATRIIEAYMWHTVIVSFTESDNFFELRRPPSGIMDPSFPAQPEMQVVAIEMYNAMKASDPTFLKEGEWHTPYIQKDEDLSLGDRLRVSAGRCARVSYLTHDGIRDIKKDLELADKLVSSKHMSPLEHQARSMADSKRYANFSGWLQFRGFVERQAAIVETIS
jgi:hypothetical protein